MNLRNTRVLTALLSLMVLLHATPARAQFTSGIEGTVTDAQGGIVPGATVTITNEETGVSQTTVTGDAGYYRFTALPRGLFSVRVTLQGFRTSLQEHVLVQVAETRTVNATLTTGNVAEEVTVTASTPLVETAQGRISGVIDESQVTDLPLVGRNFFNLVVLTPGVTGRASGGGQAYAQSNADIFINEYSVAMNANGARTESNNFMVDSSTISSSQRSGVVNVTPNPEMVEEVRVAVNNFSAEAGRNGSVVVNIVTKSGSNDWHGSASTFYTNDSLQGKNEFQKRIPGFKHSDFSRKESAWGFGGPIMRNKTFFFTSGDILRSQVAVNRNVNVLTNQFIDFMQTARPNNASTYVMKTFRASLTPERNFRTAAMHLNNTSCSGSELINSPVGPVPCNLPVSGEGTFNTTSPRRGLQWTGRVDHYLNDAKDRVYGSFNRTQVENLRSPQPDVYPDFNTLSPTNSMNLNTNWTRVMSGTSVNEASFAWVRVYGDVILNRPDIPGIQITGIERYQTTWGPNDFVQNNFEFRDVVTWTRGEHSLKTGGSFSRGHADNEGSRVFNRPIYSFDSAFDFAADNPRVQDNLAINPLTGGPVTDLLRLHRTHGLGAFIQDEWKVKPNLTLSLGIRYEGFLNIYDNAGDMTAIEFTNRTNDLRADLTTAKIVEKKNPLNGGQHTIAPRFGFAYDPSNEGKLSFRGGYGRFYERMSNQLWDSEYTNLPGFAVTTATSADIVKPVFGLGSLQDKPYNYPRPLGLTAGLNAQGGLVSGRAKADLLDPDIDTAYLDNWFVGVQRAVGANMAVEADYIGSRGNNMYIRYNVNRFSGDLFDGVANGIIPGVSNLLLGQAVDKSRYHGMTLALKGRQSDATFGAAYTFGKAIDRSSTSTPTGARQDPFGPEDQDEGPSDFDIRHKLSASLNWMLPGPSEGIAGNVLGGWQVGTVLIAQTGSPFSVICSGAGFAPVRNASGAIIGNTGCDYNADNEQNDRPNTPSFGSSRSGLSNDDFLNGIFTAADFPTPTPGTVGNLPRNSFRGPRYFNVDLSLIKNVRTPWLTGPSANLQFRVEAFNFLNSTNLTNPINNLRDSRFGRSVEALPGRIVQFSGRLSF